MSTQNLDVSLTFRARRQCSEKVCRVRRLAIASNGGTYSRKGARRSRYPFDANSKIPRANAIFLSLGGIFSSLGAYQITGISDILRGSTEASETATAQSIKAQWGSIRIRDRQAELARFCCDLTRIAAEIIAEKFQPETLWKMTGLKFPTEQEKMALQQRIAMEQATASQPAPEQGDVPAGAASQAPSNKEITGATLGRRLVVLP